MGYTPTHTHTRSCSPTHAHTPAHAPTSQKLRGYAKIAAAMQKLRCMDMCVYVRHVRKYPTRWADVGKFSHIPTCMCMCVGAYLGAHVCKGGTRTYVYVYVCVCMEMCD